MGVAEHALGESDTGDDGVREHKTRFPHVAVHRQRKSRKTSAVKISSQQSAGTQNVKLAEMSSFCFIR